MSRRHLRLRYATICGTCDASLEARSEAWWDSVAKTAHCLECPATVPLPLEPELASDVAGASARREGDRRRVQREERIRGRFGRFGGLVLALTDDPQSTKAWDRGAEGEERLATVLDELAGDRCALLHDRRIPKTRANIDHIAIVPSGVYAIDAKRYRGKVERRSPLFSSKVTLLVGGRDRTKLVPGVLKQAEVIRSTLEGSCDVPVSGVLCFIDADWALFQQPFTVDDVSVLWPKALVKMLASDGPLTPAMIAETARFLRDRLPPA